MSESNSSLVGGIVAGLAVGALVGAGLALLLAPHSGKETRGLLARKTHDLKDQASQALHGAQDLVRGKKDQLIAAVEAGREVMSHEAPKPRQAA